MKIETKYDIGQEVWFITQGERLAHARIVGIHITSTTLWTTYYFEDYAPRVESALFHTKEELLKSL